MSQYTISLRSIIRLLSEQNNTPVFGDIKQYVENGRKYIFDYSDLPKLQNFDYLEDFKKLFEKRFITYFFDENIYCNDIDTFLYVLNNEICSTMPIAFLKFQTLIKTNENELKLISKNEQNATANATSNGESSAKNSDFPYNYNLDTDLSNVHYTSNGSKSESSNNSQSNSTGVSSIYSNNIDSIKKLETISQNVIFDYVKSFQHLFMLSW